MLQLPTGEALIGHAQATSRSMEMQMHATWHAPANKPRHAETKVSLKVPAAGPAAAPEHMGGLVPGSPTGCPGCQVQVQQPQHPPPVVHGLHKYTKQVMPRTARCRR
jgi:hypothetical protein